MKLLAKYLFLLTFIAITSCKSQNNTLVFDENDYRLVSTRTDNLGIKYSETFVYDKDTSFHLKKFYWDNAKIQGVIFLNKKKKMGPAQYYDTSGILLNEDFFYKEIGIGIQYDNEKKERKLIFYQNDDIIHEADIKDYGFLPVTTEDIKNYPAIFTNNTVQNNSLKKISWTNGNIQALAFFSINKQTKNNIQYQGFYYTDKQQGITIQYGVQTKKAIIKTNKDDNRIN